MLFPLVAALAPGLATGMRPDVQRGGVHASIASAARLLSDASGAQESRRALQVVSGIVETIMAETNNATEHMSDDDAALFRSVIDLVETSIYASMDSAHVADKQALSAGAAAVEQCNAKIAARQSPNGDLGKLHQSVKDDQSELDRLKGVVDDETSNNASAWDTFDSHMQMISESPGCPAFPSKTMPTLDVYFEKSDYVVWFTTQSKAYTDAKVLWTTADAALTAAVEDYNVQKAIRDTQYCDWKNELEAACEAFEKCFTEKSDEFNKQLVPRVQSDMESRIENFKAGETIVHLIKFLLADVKDHEVPPIVTSRYELDFPTLPPKAECDLGVLASSMWVPVVDCGSGQYCLRIVTGTGGANDGHLTVVVEGSEVQTLVDGSAIFGKGDVVVAGDTCYDKPIREVRVKNPGNNAWTGTIEYSSDEGSSFQPMYCIGGCNSVGPADKIVVDGNTDGHNQADLECLSGKTCRLMPQASGPHCLRIVTGTSSANDGHLRVLVDGSEFLDGHKIFGKGDVVVAGGTCLQEPIQEVSVQNPGTNAWTGSVEYSSDAGLSFRPMYCVGGCNSFGPAGKIVVDGNTDGHDQADLECLSGKTCRLKAIRTFPSPAVIKNVHSKRRLFAQSGKSGESGVGAMRDGPIHADQKWSIEPVGDGLYKVQNVHSNRRLYAQVNKNGETGVGAVSTGDFFEDQKWYIEDVGGGRNVFRNVHNARRLFAQDDKDGTQSFNGERGVGAMNSGTVWADQKWFVEAA